MSALAKLRKIGVSKPYHGFAKLSHGFHKIECFRVTKNKFKKDCDVEEKCILVELEKQILFLPQYFVNVLDEDDLNNLNSPNESNYLYFGGKRGTNK